MAPGNLLAVALGGALGASLRYGVYHLLHGRADVAPHWAIAAVNLIGCLAIGLLFGWLDARGVDHERLRVFLAWGILGAFTTFSTYAMDTLKLLRDGRAFEAGLYLVASALAGVLLVWIGYRLTHGPTPMSPMSP